MKGMEMRITPEQFVDAWFTAYENDQSNKELAEILGESPAMVSAKAKRMRNRGIPLPKLKRWQPPEVEDLKSKAYRRLAK
jgi:DNA-binding MarR family transcriptional regulator